MGRKERLETHSAFVALISNGQLPYTEGVTSKDDYPYYTDYSTNLPC